MPQELREIWTDAYKFHATFEHMGNTQEEWTKCYETAAALVKKHRHHQLAVLLFVDAYVYLEDQRREAPGEDEAVRFIN